MTGATHPYLIRAPHSLGGPIHIEATAADAYRAALEYAEEGGLRIAYLRKDAPLRMLFAEARRMPTCRDCAYFRPSGYGHCDAFGKHARPASEDVSVSCPMFEAHGREAGDGGRA
jgi:hypothetical protein